MKKSFRGLGKASKEEYPPSELSFKNCEKFIILMLKITLQIYGIF
jgi:hypothetical protein